MKICDKSLTTYVPLRFADDNDSTYNVYTIASRSYPSHIRSLLPASENHMAEYMALEKARRRLRNVIISLMVFAISVALLAVSLVIVFQKDSANEMEINTQENGRPVISWQRTEVLVETLNVTSTSEADQSKTPSNRKSQSAVVATLQDTRSKCVGECWAYAAFRFRSTCENGFCRCNGRHYNRLTCLPSFSGCDVERNYRGLVLAKLRGVKQNVFGCRAKRKHATNFHILSIFGNHRASTTEVRITGNSSTPAVLVLVNYHPVTWKVTSDQSAAIRKVVLVSYNHLSKSNILLADLKKDTEPEVARLVSQTGYGEDKFGGHTPELLETIEKMVGSFETFSGTSHADYWEIGLDDPA
ncbi:uncharacterized protein LOC121390647 [Gigantopelta aegis]|uniref:uncharacterized protein LOC121390647 n=1 Tax=Gigantopelta aegis TaxID=1735272 RepID=UPI001B889C2C|nr:uncharacterized protein LOC121390647 [Gigantopelta aegis]